MSATPRERKKAFAFSLPPSRIIFFVCVRAPPPGASFGFESSRGRVETMGSAVAPLSGCGPEASRRTKLRSLLRTGALPRSRSRRGDARVHRKSIDRCLVSRAPRIRQATLRGHARSRFGAARSRCSRSARKKMLLRGAQHIWRAHAWICSAVHSSRSTLRTKERWTPIRRCQPEQSRQRKTPYVTDAHVGLRCGQS